MTVIGRPEVDRDQRRQGRKRPSLRRLRGPLIAGKVAAGRVSV
jgi:hypothetical protein